MLFNNHVINNKNRESKFVLGCISPDISAFVGSNFKYSSTHKRINSPKNDYFEGWNEHLKLDVTCHKENTNFWYHLFDELLADILTTIRNPGLPKFIVKTIDGANINEITTLLSEEFGIEKSEVKNDLKFYLSMIRIYERILQILFPEILYSRLQIKIREESKS